MPTGVPEPEHVELIRLLAEAVVDEIANAAKVDSSNAVQGDAASPFPDVRLCSEERRPALHFFTNCIWCLRAIDAPPRLRRSDLIRGDVADFDAERGPHSRARSSPSN